MIELSEFKALYGKRLERKGRRGVVQVRLQTIVVGIALALCLRDRPGFAVGDACGLSYAKPNELMALSEASTFDNWIPPGVACGSDDPAYTPEFCQSQTTITQDRLIGDYRLIVARSSRPEHKAMDYVFAFTCVDGRPAATTHDEIDPGLKLNYAECAQPGWGRATSTRPPEFQAKSSAPIAVTGLAGYANGQRVVVLSGITSPQAPAIACNQVQTADTKLLLRVQMPGWHGSGSYPGVDWPEDEHGWYATVVQDQMLGDERRLVYLRTMRHYPTRWACSGQLYVFGCVSGRLKAVFQDRYENLKSIDGSGENLRLVLWALNGRDPYEPGRDANLSWEKRLTYSWNPQLQGYLLSKVRVGPPPADSTLPSKPQSCAPPQ